MDTTAKMSKAAKARLEALRAEIARRTGRRVTQREVLEHLLARAGRDPATEAAVFDRQQWSMGPKEFRQFLRKRKPSGVPDLSEEVDRHLYGGSQ
jgi:protein-disulfide isomerase-like protein with CxxC motif